MSDKLATIMYTDVVGYSKLTGDNQELALEILEEHNKILYQYTKHYSGDIVKKTGDGICAIFDVAIDAIKCSIDIQKDLTKRNQLNIKERQIQIRIGIHYGDYIRDEIDVSGDGINISKNIESIAPHSGIAISETLHNLICEENDIYSREYTKLNINNKVYHIFEIYLDLIDWFNNEKNQKCHKIDSVKYYNQAHDFFHQGDYSSAIKFSVLALENSNEKKRFEISSFICNAFISLGEFEYAKEGLKYLKKDKTNNLDTFVQAHLLKMEGMLLLNNKQWNNAETLFLKSLDLMRTLESKYINEIIYYIGNIYIINNKYDKLHKILKSVQKKDDFYKLILGIKLSLLNNENDDKIKVYKNKLDSISNQHMQAIGYWYLSRYYNKFKNYDNAQECISISNELLINASEDISDWFQRDKFLKNIYIHHEIKNFSDLIVMNLQDDISFDLPVKEEQNDSTINVYKFCTQCGHENENLYKFCISCGNGLEY